MTVYKTMDDGSHQYDVLLRLEDGTCETYRTRRLLSDGGGVHLHGRGTRVWEAVRLENGKETADIVALKDSWVDDYRDREVSLNSRIRETAASQSERDMLREMMVQINAQGDVYVSDKLDRTRANSIGASFTILLASPPRSPHLQIASLVNASPLRLRFHSRGHKCTAA